MKLSFDIEEIELTPIIDLLANKVANIVIANINNNTLCNDRFISIDEAANFLSATVSWLYNNHEKEGIICYKIGGLKFKKSELIKWSKKKQKA